MHLLAAIGRPQVVLFTTTHTLKNGLLCPLKLPVSAIVKG